jgi:hypothetical protein
MVAPAAIILASASDILEFDNTATAGASTITNNGGELDFDELTTAGSANITNGGKIFLANAASAGRRRSTPWPAARGIRRLLHRRQRAVHD